MFKLPFITKLILALTICFAPVLATGQMLSPNSKITLLTCGQGEELYSTFGHSAIRVCDTAQQVDIVFNYGIFDFSDPDFYWNFANGKLNYMLGVERFSDFILAYKMDERWVYEQTFNLTTEQQQALFDFLIVNYQPGNRYYRYDFLFDNCSSRVRDVLEKVYPNQVTYPNKEMESKPTFRDLLYPCLENMPWSKLGIDLMLAYRVDKIATPREYMFLPDHLCEAIEHTTINGQPLVTTSDYLFQSSEPAHAAKPVFTPFIAFVILLVLVVAATFAKLPLKGFDFALFLIVGLLGFFLVFMWVGTEHHVTKGNFNLLWAFPLHAVAACLLFKKQRPRWLLWYFAANALVCVVVLVFWSKLPQQLNIALLPIVCLLGFRSYSIAKPLLTGAWRRS